MTNDLILALLIVAVAVGSSALIWLVCAAWDIYRGEPIYIEGNSLVLRWLGVGRK